MRAKALTDEQVELEIERLKGCPEVRLAQKERRLKNKRRQYMCQLRCMERRGKELTARGITSENIDEMLKQADNEIKRELD